MINRKPSNFKNLSEADKQRVMQMLFNDYTKGLDKDILSVDIDDGIEMVNTLIERIKTNFDIDLSSRVIVLTEGRKREG